MDFARKILKAYGWKDGDGLGKNRDGIANPLRATLKFDNAGFGANQAEADFNNHWWDRVYNEATTNVNITKEGDQIQITLKGNDNVEISTKGYSVKKLKKIKQHRGESNKDKSNYHNFLQAATLTKHGDEIESPNKINTDDIDVSKINLLTDEELFRACGGRTAHKGARHGLKQSGKLLRIEQQEAEMLAKIMAKHTSGDNCNGNSTEPKDITKCINEQTSDQGRIQSESMGEGIDTLSSTSSKFPRKKRKHYELNNSKTAVNVECIKKKAVTEKAEFVESNDKKSLNVDLKLSTKTRKNKTRKQL